MIRIRGYSISKYQTAEYLSSFLLNLVMNKIIGSIKIKDEIKFNNYIHKIKNGRAEGKKENPIKRFLIEKVLPYQ